MIDLVMDTCLHLRKFFPLPQFVKEFIQGRFQFCSESLNALGTSVPKIRIPAKKKVFF